MHKRASWALVQAWKTAFSLIRPWAILNIENQEKTKSDPNLCPPFKGLPAERLLHCYPGPPGPHGGGFLEDGLGVEVPHHCDAHRGAGARAGEWPHCAQLLQGCCSGQCLTWMTEEGEVAKGKGFISPFVSFGGWEGNG